MAAEKRKMPTLRAVVDAHRRGAQDPWISEQLGLDRRGLWSWWNRGLTQMPSPYLLYNLARTIEAPYRDVLDAALSDFDYLPQSAAANTDPPARLKKAKGTKIN